MKIETKRVFSENIWNAPINIDATQKVLEKMKNVTRKYNPNIPVLFCYSIIMIVYTIYNE